MLSLICLRRSKKAIQLPNRRDKIHKVAFDEQETARYESVNEKLVQSLQQTSEMAAASTANVLSKINLLRQICNLGLHYQGAELFTPTALRDQEPIGQELFDCMLSAGAAICNSCGKNFSMDSYASSSPSKEVTTLPSHPYISTCGRLLCATCSTLPQVVTSISRHLCSLALGCKFRPVSTSESVELSIGPTSTLELPSKVKALINDLLGLPEMDKRYSRFVCRGNVLTIMDSIVFSFWTTTLDLVGIALTNFQIPFTRLDGSMAAKHRQCALTSFINNPKIKVILISLRCGANGLNLTIANHVFLMEPQWNPMIDDRRSSP